MAEREIIKTTCNNSLIQMHPIPEKKNKIK